MKSPWLQITTFPSPQTKRMFRCSIFLLILILTVINSASSNDNNTAHNLKNLKEATSMVTVTVKRPVETVFAPVYVTVVVNKELAIESSVIEETAVVTQTVISKHPGFNWRVGQN
jgi:hypothetical protein